MRFHLISSPIWSPFLLLPPGWCEPSEHQLHRRPKSGLETSKMRKSSPRVSWCEGSDKTFCHDFCSKHPLPFILCVSSNSFIINNSQNWVSVSLIQGPLHQALPMLPDLLTHTRLSNNHEITSCCRWWLILCPLCNRIWQRGDETFGKMGVQAASAGPHSARGELQLLCRW